MIQIFSNYIFDIVLSIIFDLWEFVNYFNNKPLVHCNIDINDYLGSWYEIARLPNEFQLNHYRGKAIYTLIDDKSFGIDNIQIKDNMYIDGKKIMNDKDIKITRDSITGRGYYYKLGDNMYDGRFMINFDNSKFYAPYWIIYFKKHDNYKISVVSDPTKKYCWILCSDNKIELDDVNLLETKNKLLEYGYNIEKFVYHHAEK